MRRGRKARLTDAVADPGAVVVELGHAAVAHGAVLGAQRPPHEARRAEARRLEPAPRRLRQLDNRLRTIITSSANDVFVILYFPHYDKI